MKSLLSPQYLMIFLFTSCCSCPCMCTCVYLQEQTWLCSKGRTICDSLCHMTQDCSCLRRIVHSQLFISRISVLVSSTSKYFQREKARKANTKPATPSDVLKSNSKENTMKHYLLSQTSSKFCQRADYYRVFQILSV